MAAGLYVLEPTGPRDLPAVMRVASRSLTEQYDERFFVAMLESSPETFLVTRDLVTGRVVGFGLAVRDSQVTSRLLILAVEGALQGHGLGARLLKELEMRLRNRGVLDLALEVREDNVRAIAFYHRHGYEIQGAVPRYYADGSRAVVMSKGL